MKKDDNDTIARNRKIDRRVVTAFQNLERTARTLRIEETRRKYALEPPLGQKPTSNHSSNG